MIDTATTILCPYCNEQLTISVDISAGNHQSYVEDCHVCCQPMLLTVQFDSDGLVQADAEQE